LRLSRKEERSTDDVGERAAPSQTRSSKVLEQIPSFPQSACDLSHLARTWTYECTKSGCSLVNPSGITKSYCSVVLLSSAHHNPTLDLDSLSTKPSPLKAIQEPQRTHPPRALPPLQPQRSKRPPISILIPSTQMEPKLVLDLHLGSDDQGCEVEPLVTRFIDDDLARLECPVIEGACVPHDSPDRVVRVVFREIGPKNGAALLEVDGGREEVGGVAERDVVW